MASTRQDLSERQILGEDRLHEDFVARVVTPALLHAANDIAAPPINGTGTHEGIACKCTRKRGRGAALPTPGHIPREFLVLHAAGHDGPASRSLWTPDRRQVGLRELQDHAIPVPVHRRRRQPHRGGDPGRRCARRRCRARRTSLVTLATVQFVISFWRLEPGCWARSKDVCYARYMCVWLLMGVVQARSPQSIEIWYSSRASRPDNMQYHMHGPSKMSIVTLYSWVILFTLYIFWRLES